MRKFSAILVFAIAIGACVPAVAKDDTQAYYQKQAMKAAKKAQKQQNKLMNKQLKAQQKAMKKANKEAARNQKALRNHTHQTY